MSKADAQRAMREARHAELRAAAAERAKSRPPDATTGQPATTAQPATPAQPGTEPGRQGRSGLEGTRQTEPDGGLFPLQPDVAGAGDAAEPALCGHRNIGNKRCRRPAGHPEKSHRYS